MVVIMVEPVLDQEYVVVLVVGVEAHVLHVCEFMACGCNCLIKVFVIKLYVLMVVSMVEPVLDQEFVHVLLGGLVMTAGKVHNISYIYS